MNRQKPSPIVLVAITLLVVSLLIPSGNLAAARPEPSAPEYYGYISNSVVSVDTWGVYLTIDGLGGEVPPSAKWYDPSGSQVSAGCVGGQLIREYVYSYGVLVQVKDYFYIGVCDREPGLYRVIVGGDIDLTFRIKGYAVFLPIVVRAPAPPGAFAKQSPGNGATGQALSLILDWDDSGGADSYAYCYDTTDDNACSNWLDTGATSQASVTGLSEDTTYFWQVRATNALGTTYADGDSTAYWSFTTGSGAVIPSEMILIPAGEFEMGCHPDHNAGVSCFSPNLPLHTVYLDAYRIDKYEVTNAQYAQCVVAGACSAPTETSSYTRPFYYGNPDYGDFPVIYVTWQDAYDYCAWVGKRLPTEAEWEKAARGTGVQTFPWGDQDPTCALVNFSASFSNQCVGDTSQVGDYPAGASPFGVLDMAGNVWEWVNDWYDAEYYQTSPYSNPPGPASGANRVCRGGGYGSMGQDIVTSVRSYGDPEVGRLHTGIRCAAAPEP